jgi:hypothetical protein
MNPVLSASPRKSRGEKSDLDLAGLSVPIVSITLLTAHDDDIVKLMCYLFFKRNNESMLTLLQKLPTSNAIYCFQLSQYNELLFPKTLLSSAVRGPATGHQAPQSYL